TSVLDLKEKASSLASNTLKKDNRLKTLEIGLEQKKEECVKLENQLKKAQNAGADSHTSSELSERISGLEEEVSQHKEDAARAQSEVERLLEILREMENEKNDKEKKINELERNPSASHLWRPQQSGKQAPPPAASQQPMGGLVWDYLGTFAS
ncbi:ELKS/Rab6-interacting/CAST family member 1-like, partial [Notothenia coriiceps]|uniref:ELKS/Rab6-interacting/CAST family member 1-like n=1 Tax=Notothenia coriiceps TaxID=8208 RepID=A0A6I9PB84_9TELE